MDKQDSTLYEGEPVTSTPIQKKTTQKRVPLGNINVNVPHKTAVVSSAPSMTANSSIRKLVLFLFIFVKSKYRECT